MACTTILVEQKSVYDGSTMIARNDDSPSGRFTPKKYVVVHPDEQPRKLHICPFPCGKSTFRTIRCVIPLYPTPLKAWLSGRPAASMKTNVAMTATETITSNPRVLGAVSTGCLSAGQRMNRRD